MVYVVADSHKKFVGWCREVGLNPFPGAHQARYVQQMEQLLGTKGIRLVFLDTSWSALQEREAMHYVRCMGGTVEYAYA